MTTDERALQIVRVVLALASAFCFGVAVCKAGWL